jgi:hypothetical protein
MARRAETRSVEASISLLMGRMRDCMGSKQNEAELFNTNEGSCQRFSEGELRRKESAGVRFDFKQGIGRLIGLDLLGHQQKESREAVRHFFT